MSNSLAPTAMGPDRSPILIVPYMWIGDFVRCHTVIQLLRARFPERPVDMLTTTLCAPLTDYMPACAKPSSLIFRAKVSLWRSRKRLPIASNKNATAPR